MQQGLRPLRSFTWLLTNMSADLVLPTLVQHGPLLLRGALLGSQRLMQCAYACYQPGVPTLGALASCSQESSVHAERRASNAAASSSKAAYHSQRDPIWNRSDEQERHRGIVRDISTSPQLSAKVARLQRHREPTHLHAGQWIPSLPARVYIPREPQVQIQQQRRQQQPEQQQPKWQTLPSWQALPPHLQTVAAAVLQRLPEADPDEVEPFVRKLHGLQKFKSTPGGWASAAEIRPLVMSLQLLLAPSPAALLKIFTKAPHLLLTKNLPKSKPLVQQLQQIQSSLTFTQDQLWDLILKRPKLLQISQEELSDQLDYLLGPSGLQLTSQEAAAVVQQNPSVLVTPRSRWAANVGFIVGLGFTPEQVKQLVLAQPGWLTLHVKDLIVRWNFFTKELKVSLNTAGSACLSLS